MTNIILTTPEELKELISEVIADTLPSSPTAKPLPDTINIDTAVSLLQEHGLEISRATLYKFTSRGDIPYSKFGNRLIFSREKLLQWMSEQIVDIPTNEDMMQSLDNNFKKRRS